jgi:hypothetical protein
VIFGMEVGIVVGRVDECMILWMKKTLRCRDLGY